LDKYPAVILFPTFALPASLEKRDNIRGIDVNGLWTIQVSGPKVEQVAKELETKTLRFSPTFRGHSFPRLIAKIAYGVSVADFGLDGIETAYVLPAILGKSNDIGQWVGCDKEMHIKEPNYFHGVGRTVDNGEIIVRVRLFAQFGAPEYVVVVGRIAKGAKPGKLKLLG